MRNAKWLVSTMTMVDRYGRYHLLRKKKTIRGEIKIQKGRIMQSFLLSFRIHGDKIGCAL